jgi:hypothetical protein
MRARLESRRARARVACLLLIAALGLGGGRAHADEAEREEARKEFAAGQAADRRKDWQAAIEHYLRANDLVPHPFAVYNIAVDYERLGKLREAATWYERYLAATTDARERDRVQRTLHELRARPSPLAVQTIPERAQVHVDAVPVGVTPYRGTIRPGFHRISVELEGRRAHRDVTVEYAEPVNLDFTLRARPGTLRVRGAPYGAVLHVDGRAAGRIPARVPLEAGPHTVRVTSPGHAPFETTVHVEAGREAEVDARLQRGPGGVAGPGGATRTIRAAYLLGFAGGADVRGGGGFGMGELGIRVGPLDASVRYGRAAGVTAADLLARWALTSGRIAPFLGGGLMLVEEAAGYSLSAGVRWDLVRGERGGLSLLAESGLRYYRAPESGSGSASESDRGIIVPLMASVLYLYK